MLHTLVNAVVFRNANSLLSTGQRLIAFVNRCSAHCYPSFTTTWNTSRLLLMGTGGFLCLHHELAVSCHLGCAREAIGVGYDA